MLGGGDVGSLVLGVLEGFDLFAGGVAVATGGHRSGLGGMMSEVEGLGNREKAFIPSPKDGEHSIDGGEYLLNLVRFLLIGQELWRLLWLVPPQNKIAAIPA